MAVAMNPATTDQLKELAARTPGLNLTEAAKIVGITRERVRQIANKHGLPLHRGHHRNPRPLCDLCNTEVQRAHNYRHMACIQRLAKTPEQRAHCKAVLAKCHRNWVDNNREHMNAYSREYQRTERSRAYKMAWQARNPEKVRQYRLAAAVKLLGAAGYTIHAE